MNLIPLKKIGVVLIECLDAAGIEFLEFKPSEIAAAVAMYVSGEMQAMDIDKALSCLVGVEKVCVFMLVPP